MKDDVSVGALGVRLDILVENAGIDAFENDGSLGAVDITDVPRLSVAQCQASRRGPGCRNFLANVKPPHEAEK